MNGRNLTYRKAHSLTNFYFGKFTRFAKKLSKSSIFLTISSKPLIFDQNFKITFIVRGLEEEIIGGLLPDSFA